MCAPMSARPLAHNRWCLMLALPRLLQSATELCRAPQGLWYQLLRGLRRVLPATTLQEQPW